MQEFYLIAAAAFTILSSARLTRLAVYDEFPPVVWLRAKYESKTKGTGWALLAICNFCMSFWVTLLVVAWADLVGVYHNDPGHTLNTQAWWFVTGVLAASYLAASYVARDGDDA